jgi:hypothetical protein
MGTRGLLRRRLAGLVALTVLASGLLYAAYADLHRRPAEVRDRIAPAVLEVAAARTALMTAHNAAESTLDSGLSEVVGPGEEYQTQIAAASQSLSHIAEDQVAGEKGELRPDTVDALLDAYSQDIGRAVEHNETEVLRETWFLSADAVLNRDASGLLDRLDGLQDSQADTLREETSFTGTRWVVWALAGAALLGLGLLLVLTQWQLSRRFPQRLNPYLLVATALLLASAVAVPLARDTQERLDDARGELDSLISAQRGTVADENLADSWLETIGRRTTSVAEGVQTGMDETESRAGLVNVIPATGLTVGALSWLGIWRHLARYHRYRP